MWGMNEWANEWMPRRILTSFSESFAADTAQLWTSGILIPWSLSVTAWVLTCRIGYNSLPVSLLYSRYNHYTQFQWTPTQKIWIHIFSRHKVTVLGSSVRVKRAWNSSPSHSLRTIVTGPRNWGDSEAPGIHWWEVLETSQAWVMQSLSTLYLVELIGSKSLKPQEANCWQKPCSLAAFRGPISKGKYSWPEVFMREVMDWLRGREDN